MVYGLYRLNQKAFFPSRLVTGLTLSLAEEGRLSLARRREGRTLTGDALWARVPCSRRVHLTASSLPACFSVCLQCLEIVPLSPCLRVTYRSLISSFLWGQAWANVPFGVSLHISK